MELTGPDVSRWQGTVDWPAVASDGHAFAWCKASQGVTWRDPQFARNWVGIAAAGMVRGAYHFLDAEYGGREQAAHFVSTVGSFAGSMAALDVESEGSSNPTIDQAEAFAAEFARLTGGHPLVIYTGIGWWGPRDRDGRGGRISPWLWHARYRSLSLGPGALYGGWDRFTFWQHTSSGTCRGISGRCDLNVLYGGRPVLAQLTRTPGAKPAPDPEDVMNTDQEAKLDRTLAALSRVEDALRDSHGVTARLGVRVQETTELARALATTADGVDEAEVAEIVLRSLTPQAIAAALPDTVAAEVADELAARLAG